MGVDHLKAEDIIMGRSGVICAVRLYQRESFVIFLNRNGINVFI